MKEQQKESERAAEGEWQRRRDRLAEGEWQRVCAELEQRRGTFVIRLARSRLRVAITEHEGAERRQRGGKEEGGSRWERRKRSERGELVGVHVVTTVWQQRVIERRRSIALSGTRSLGCSC